jgi:glycosyltransferase involved in cell wall biosynthesis
MNILAHSQFMVLPLAGSEIPCGHVTLVSAMHLGKAFIISNSSGVADYVQDGRTAIACEAFSADALEAAVRRLWDDRPYRDRLAHQGRAFATEFCSEANTLAWFRRYLTGKGLLSEDTGTG